MAGIVARTIKWGELNDELLNLILSKVFGKDRFSFSLVCKHWNAVAANSRYQYTPTCLVYYNWSTHDWIFKRHNRFFSTSFPELENAELRCSKYRWLLMSRYDDTLFFFDPRNNRKIELPCKVKKMHYPLCFFNPPTSPDCLVVGIKTKSYDTNVEICALKRGEDEWDCMEFTFDEEEGKFMVLFAAPVMHNGLIYFLSMLGDVAVLDIEKRDMKFFFDCLCPDEEEDEYDIREQYLVKVEGDEAMYGVFVFDEDREVTLFRLSSDMKWDWVEEGIMDRVFYISPNSCYGEKAPLKSMGNAICFPMFHGDSPVFYTLNEDMYHSINGEYSEDNAYGLKRLNRAAWLTQMPRIKKSTQQCLGLLLVIELQNNLYYIAIDFQE